MALTKEDKKNIITTYGLKATNTGSTHAQIALLTARIIELTEHFKTHKKDHSSRRSLLKIIGKRRRLLRYLQKNNLEEYRTLIAQLGIRK